MSSDTLLDKRSWLSGLMVGVREGGGQEGVGQQQGSSSVHAFNVFDTVKGFGLSIHVHIQTYINPP